MEFTPTDPSWKAGGELYRGATEPRARKNKIGTKSGMRVRMALGLVASLMLVALVICLIFDFHTLRGEFAAQRQADTYTSSVDATRPLPLEAGLELYVLGRGI